jgi:hypothetical protein
MHREIKENPETTNVSTPNRVVRRRQQTGVSRGREPSGKLAVVEAGLAEAQLTERGLWTDRYSGHSRTISIFGSESRVPEPASVFPIGGFAQTGLVPDVAFVYVSAAAIISVRKRGSPYGYC